MPEASLREQLESAYEHHDAPDAEAGRPTADAPESVGTPAEKSSAATEGAGEKLGLREDRGDGRTVRGKFAPRTPAVAPAGDAGATQPAGDTPAVDVGQAAAVDPYNKAPQSWKPGAREVWAKLPTEVRAEVHRRESETAHVMQETAQARQVHDYLGQLQQTYAPALQAEGVDVLTASANLMQLASRLRFGTPPEKAQMAAQIIRNYGVDVNALADALDGIPAQAQPGQMQQQPMMQDPRVDQLFEQLSAMRQNREQQIMEKAVTEVEQFGGDKEFFEDVREDMADILDLATKRGIDLPLDQAYERACRLHPEISKVLVARERAAQAGNLRGSTQRAKDAASSVRGTPSGVSTAQPNTLRSQIESAMEEVGGR
jgi:hypothetical protein